VFVVVSRGHDRRVDPVIRQSQWEVEQAAKRWHVLIVTAPSGEVIGCRLVAFLIKLSCSNVFVMYLPRILAIINYPKGQGTYKKMPVLRGGNPTDWWESWRFQAVCVDQWIQH
jgi:hypothetical protein